MMEPFTTTKQIQRMATIGQHWQRLTELHWLLVEPAQIPTRLKHLIFQPTLGLKLQIILITISKLILLFDIKKSTPCSHLISAFIYMPLLQQAKEPFSLVVMVMVLRSLQLLAITTLDGANWMTCNQIDVSIVRLSMAIKFMSSEELEQGKS